MNGDSTQSQIYRNTYNYPISMNQHPEPLNFKLLSQQQAIKSIAINNPKNLGVTVIVFGGPSAAGSPIFVCLPGKSARIPVEGNYPLHVKFDAAGPQGKPLADGFIFIAVTSEMGPEIFTPDSVGLDDGATVNIGTMPNVIIDPVGSSALGSLSVTVAGGITVNPPVYPPIGQIPVQAFIAPTINTLTFQNNTRIQLDPLAAITNPLFTMAIGVGGFNRQPFVQWRFATRGTNGNYNLLIRGWGNRELIFPQPYYQTLRSLSAQGLFFDVLNADALIGNLPINVFYSGYYS